MLCGWDDRVGVTWCCGCARVGMSVREVEVYIYAGGGRRKSRGKVWVAFPFFVVGRFMIVTTYTYSLGHTLTLSRYLFPIYYLFILFVLRLQVGEWVGGRERRKECRLDQMRWDAMGSDWMLYIPCNERRTLRLITEGLFSLTTC